MGTVLPRPDVEAVVGDVPTGKSVSVTISRDGKGKSYTGESVNTGGAVAEVVKKIINDPVSAEWLP